MGASNNNDLPSFSYAASMEDRRFSKNVYDNVHGNIYLDPLTLKFIDTEQFQRLRDLKQLGVTYMVYPGAVHSRFEHSLGVYSLAGDAIHKIKSYQGMELGIDDFDIQTVKLAGLLHDVGHGPFSHLFEHAVVPKVLNGSKWSHEEMSLKMIDHIVDVHNIDIDPESLKKVKEMIIASSENAPSKSSKEKRFLYDIVANGRNGIDVDKFDYIVRDSRACGLGCSFHFQRLLENMRVIDDEICYRAKEHLTIHKLFSSRADLHRTVYMHAKVKAIELMFVDALQKTNDYFGLASSIQDPAEYWKLDDSIIKRIETSSDQQLKESRDLIQRIRRRDLYQFCNEFAVPKDKLEHFKNVTAQDIICSQKTGSATLKEEDVAVSNVKIDLTHGRKNPVERINFFKDYESNEKFHIQDERISHLLPAYYQDMIVRVYSKKPELVEAVSDAFENFQLRMYGMKTQVHATPEKKKRRM
ncbi:deoxynucleoside triphosphate triphosphohydrolase SAMHD1 homolog isoform X1 [Camellia sinensis]|uniref:deoxynucleoside triphosphate triphosphohydrolase SAMHD1 homolog isoform X1 n=2 Tax=Camellia sinensis TaxID=4442 RepID=UPI0010355847|nr:deoxynucleoside triphosphate triphosphohydrolase SAMHD1 homolog isoform X1 [Camellia sinensis]